MDPGSPVESLSIPGAWAAGSRSTARRVLTLSPAWLCRTRALRWGIQELSTFPHPLQPLF